MLVRASLLLVLLLHALPAAAAQERVVHVHNWTDYIDPAAIAKFQRETGYPPPKAVAGFFTDGAVPQAAERARTWVHFKAGR